MLFYAIQQIVEIEVGLWHQILNTELSHILNEIKIVRSSSQHDHGQVMPPMASSDHPQQLNPIHLRQHQIQQYQIGCVNVHQRPGLSPVIAHNTVSPSCSRSLETASRQRALSSTTRIVGIEIVLEYVYLGANRDNASPSDLARLNAPDRMRSMSPCTCTLTRHGLASGSARKYKPSTPSLPGHATTSPTFELTFPISAKTC